MEPVPTIPLDDQPCCPLCGEGVCGVPTYPVYVCTYCVAFKDIEAQSTKCKLCCIVVEGVKTWLREHQPGTELQSRDAKVDIFFHDESYSRITLDGVEIPIQSKTSILEFYTEPSRPSIFPTITAGRADEESLFSTGSVTLAKEWMHDCLHNHQRCMSLRSDIGDDSPLPTRIIDVGSSDGVPYLLETHGRRGKYFTLSHCWGRQQLITTTTHNVEKHKRGIPWPELSKSFQEAIQITREFGCQYLWIDSLCILQDSVRDWEIESSRMAAIYRNCLMSISATDAVDGSRGCFVPKEFIRRNVSSILAPGKNGGTVEVHIRPSPRWDDDFHSQRKGLLFQRGWVFQERLLAPRILSFSAMELTWYCKEKTFCACRPWYNNNQIDNNRQQFLKMIDDDKYPGNIYNRWDDEWHKVVTAYSGLDLTFDTDILPALSGIASLWPCPVGDMYLSGLWKSNLPLELLWHRNTETMDRIVGARRSGLSGTYCAPSWSWASLRNPISFFYRLSPPTSLATVVDVMCQVDGANPWGRVSDGYIILKAPCSRVNLSCVSDPTTGYYTHCIVCPPDDSYEENESFILDITAPVSEAAKAHFDTQAYWCLQIAISPKPTASRSLQWRHSLLLKQAERDPNAYERVAMWRMDVEKWPNWDLGPEVTVKIV